MSERDHQLVLEDIIASIERIERFTAKHDADSFAKDEMASDATILNLAIIGEASKLIPEEIKTLMPSIVWKDVIGLRNIIIHKYFAVDLAIIWRIVSQDLPPLKSNIQQALAHLNQSTLSTSSTAGE
ncbi:MAG: DUF86 domain-containing protein [Acidobacteria bacterium]|nr:DUF86 domain-containing protein [Acidobacteriota bacterium]